MLRRVRLDGWRRRALYVLVPLVILAGGIGAFLAFGAPLRTTGEAGTVPVTPVATTAPDAPDKPAANTEEDSGDGDAVEPGETEGAEGVATLVDEEEIAREERAALEQAAADQYASERASQEADIAQAEAAAAESRQAARMARQRVQEERRAARQQAAAAQQAPGEEMSDPTNLAPEALAAPSSTTFSLAVPKLGLHGIPVVDDTSEAGLSQGAGHLPGTGFPWIAGSNTYIAGHRLGYAGTPSDHVFYNLPSLVVGDEVILTDANGKSYTYAVSEILEVSPYDLSVTAPVPGRDVVTLQTCIENFGDYWTPGPNWLARYVVRADRVA